jgi:hypothetical protein
VRCFDLHPCAPTFAQPSNDREVLPRAVASDLNIIQSVFANYFVCPAICRSHCAQSLLPKLGVSDVTQLRGVIRVDYEADIRPYPF